MAENNVYGNSMILYDIARLYVFYNVIILSGIEINALSSDNCYHDITGINRLANMRALEMRNDH